MTFYNWLMKNRWRGDSIGELAREVPLLGNWRDIKAARFWADLKGIFPERDPKGRYDPRPQALRKAWNEYTYGAWKKGTIEPWMRAMKEVIHEVGATATDESE